MHDVTFGYGNSGEAPTSGSDADAPESSAEPILSHVSFDIPQHGILGIQGPSGRGKSTLLKLLMRYWDPQSGLVALSEVPLPQIDAHHRRRVQTMMGQETYLFDGTIRENLLMACDRGDADRLVMLAIRTIPRLPAERFLPRPLLPFRGMPLIPRFPPGRPLLSVMTCCAPRLPSFRA